jgi:hypothetical protein
VLGQKTFSVILNDQSVMDMFFLQDSCVDVLVVFFSLLKYFPVIFTFVFNFLLSEEE